MRDVLKNLIDGLAEAWVKVGKYWRVPMFIGNHTSSAAIGNKGDESVVSSVSETNGDRGDFRSVFEWAADCRHRWYLFRYSRQ